MKTLIVYYSYSGITDKVVKVYADLLGKKGEVVLQRLTPRQEITTFLGQCKAAFAGKRAELDGNVKFNVQDYDLVVIGSPVWAFAPTPSINTYLDKLSGLEGKRAIILLTSGSGAGVKKCFKNIRTALESKGASRIDEINIPNRKMQDENFINSSLQNLL